MGRRTRIARLIWIETVLVKAGIRQRPVTVMADPPPLGQPILIKGHVNFIISEIVQPEGDNDFGRLLTI